MSGLQKTLWPFIWQLLRPYKFQLCILILVAAVYALDVAIRPYILKVIIDKVNLNPNAANLFGILLWPFLSYVSMLLVVNVSFRLWNLVALKVFPEIKAAIVRKMLDYTHSHSYEFFQNNFAGNIANKITNDLSNGVEAIIQNVVDGMLPHLLVLLFGIFTLMTCHFYFGILACTWVVVSIVITLKLSRHTRDASTILAHSKSNLVGAVVDSLSNFINVTLFSRKKHELKFVETYLQDVINKDKAFQWLNFYRNVFYSASVVILSTLMLVLLIYTKQQALITVGDFALVLALSFSVLDSAYVLAREYLDFVKELGICRQALSLLNQPHNIVNKPDAKPLIITDGEIRFNNISFGYTRDMSLFNKQSIIIPAKQKTGLVGYSGSGKTTLVNLIVRLFDVREGEVLIDGQNIKNVTKKSLRQNIGFIPQDPILFHRSLKDNIRYGQPDASDQEVIEAAQKANAHGFIMNAPEGYDSGVGERGIKLSGGQRQRIAIARAILKNAPILILDEATSSLDSVTEKLIQSSLEILMQNKTVIVVAHRLSTLLSMDRIIVFDKGRIKEEGTHDELIAQRGLYYTLWNSQVGGYLPNDI